jgi:hypothetical protein
MQESTGRESSMNETEKDRAGADSDATSKETLKDIEDNQGDVAPSSPDPDPDPDPGPAPDGAPDKNDDTKDTGPM